MKTPTITINIAGHLTLDRTSLEQFLASFTTPTQSFSVEQPKIQTGDSSFIDEKQLLAKLSISRRTLFNWRMMGKIPSVKIGRRTLYHWPSVEAALLRCQRGDYS